MKSPTGHQLFVGCEPSVLCDGRGRIVAVGAEARTTASGWGDSRLRIWGIKAFLDGSLGSRTAEMLDGRGVARIPDPELDDLIDRCLGAELNLCMHAIGDGAVHRALLALERHPSDWPGWRPRIEHAQCVDPDDIARFRATGTVASMQPIHAVADREMADAEWGATAEHGYAWARLARAGVPLAFGSDAPVESPDPLLGLDGRMPTRGPDDDPRPPGASGGYSVLRVA